MRKQQKEHTNLIAEYRSKQQQHQQGTSMLAPGPSTQASHMLSKMPGQLIGQPPGGIPQAALPQGGMPIRMPQMQPFGGAQPSLPLGAGPVQPPPVFFPQGPGPQVPDPRVLQERQLQHRMQMVQKMQQQQQQQQQLMMGQQPISHQPQQPGIMNQQPGAIGSQPAQVLMGGMGQPNLQQGLINSQQNQQGLMQAPPGMMGNQALGQTQHNVMGQQMTQTANLMAGQPQGMVGNQQIVQQLQRPQGLMDQHGPVGQHVVRGPPTQLTPQQQSVMAQRMLMSQQNAAKNLAQLQQQQISQLKQQAGPSETQRALEAPPSGGNQGVAENLQQGIQDHQNPNKDGGLLSPKTPPQQGGPPTPLQMQQGSSGEQQCVVGQPQQPHAFLGQQQTAQPQPNQNIGVAEQHGFVGNQQAGPHLKVQPPQPQMPVGLQTQTKIQIKQEDQQMCFMTQQQGGQIAVQQPQEVAVQNSGQTMGNITNQQQQALLTQQMGIPRAQQMMMTQRPGVPAGQTRTSINIQAFIAQNPQLRHLTPSQQLQQIQAMLAQRQLQQGQMLRLQGQTQGQMRPQVPQGPSVGPRITGIENQQQQHRFGLAGKHSSSTQQQSGVIGQQSGMAPQFHQGVGGAMQQPSQGPLPQYINNAQQQQMIQQQQVHQHQMIRGQVPRPIMGQVRTTAPGHMTRPMSPRQLLGQGSPGSPLSNQQRLMRMSQTPPGTQHLQQQSHGTTALSPFQASPSHAGSPAGSSVPETGSPSLNKPEPGSLALSSHLSSPSRPDGIVGKSSPFSQTGGLIPSPLRSPTAKTQSPNTEALSASFPLNGPSPQSAQNQAPNSGQISGGHTSQPTQMPSEMCKMTLKNIKQEPREVQCDAGNIVETHSDGIKREISGESVSGSAIVNSAVGSRNPAGDLGSQIQRTETGQQLLQKLLRTKNLQVASQRPSDGIHNEINGHINNKLAMLEQKLQGTPRNMEVQPSRQFHGEYVL